MLSTRQLVLKAVTRKPKPPFVRPFQVEAQVGANTFKLILPTTMQVHQVFNISLLQPYQGEYIPLGPSEI